MSLRNPAQRTDGARRGGCPPGSAEPSARGDRYALPARLTEYRTLASLLSRRNTSDLKRSASQGDFATPAAFALFVLEPTRDLFDRHRRDGVNRQGRASSRCALALSRIQARAG